MKKLFPLLILGVLFLSIQIPAQMKLKIALEPQEEYKIFGSQDMQSNLKLTVPPDATALPMNGFMSEGAFMLALLVDYTLPLGDDFKNFADNGFSGHVLLGYILAKSWMLTLQTGYISFGEKVYTQGSSFEQTYCHSQIPVLLGLTYLISTRNKFHPFIGFALGLFILKDKWTNRFLEQEEEFDESESKFGIAPNIGFIYMVGATVAITLMTQYSIIFHEAGGPDSSNLSQISFMLGAMMALGGG